MLVLKRVGIAGLGILNLKEVRLAELIAPSRQRVGVLLLISGTGNEIDIVLTDMSVISKGVLHQCVSIGTSTLGEFLIGLGQVDTVALNPGRNPSEVLSVSLAIGEIDLIIKVLGLGIQTDHLQQVNVCRACTYEAVNKCVAFEQVVDEQRIGSGDITMHQIVVHTIAISIIVVATGRTDFVVEYPSRRIVSLDGRLHKQCTTKHVGYIAIKSLHILRGIGNGHVVLLGMRINDAGLELDELGVHRVVHTCRVALIVRTGTLDGSLLIEVVERYIIGVVSAATTEVDIMVLTDTGLEDFIEPIGIGSILEMVLAILAELIAAGKCGTTVGTCLTNIVAVLICVHQIIYAFRNLVYAEVTAVVNLQRLILTTMLGGDDDHTITSTRTVDGTGGSILQNLDRLYIIG